MAAKALQRKAVVPEQLRQAILGAVAKGMHALAGAADHLATRRPLCARAATGEFRGKDPRGRGYLERNREGGGGMGPQRKFTAPQIPLYFETAPNFYLLWSAGDERLA
jgi:hypothetical protein